jgi:hypothetical protein
MSLTQVREKNSLTDETDTRPAETEAGLILTPYTYTDVPLTSECLLKLLTSWTVVSGESWTETGRIEHISTNCFFNT